MLYYSFIYSLCVWALKIICSTFHGKFWINDEQTGRSVYYYENANICIYNTGCCFCSVVKSYLTPCDPMDAASQAFLSSTISQSLLKFMSIELVVLSNHLILCHCLLLPSIFPSTRVFSNKLVLHIRWSKDWILAISPCNEYSRLISFRTD